MINLRLVLLLALFALANVCQSYAQGVAPVTTVTMDTFSRLPDKYCPFDERFYLVIPIDSDKRIKAVNVYKSLRPSSTGTWRLASAKPQGASLISFSVEITSKSKNNLHVFMPGLDPNQYYAVAIQYTIGNNYLIRLEAINQLLCQNQVPNAQIQAQALYANFISSIAAFNSQSTASNIEDLSDIITFGEYLNFYSTTLANNYTSILNALTNTEIDPITGENPIAKAYGKLFSDLAAINTLCNDVHGRTAGNGEFRSTTAGSFSDSIALTLCNIKKLVPLKIQISQNELGILDYLNSGNINVPMPIKQFDRLNKNLNANLDYVKRFRKYLMSTDFTGSGLAGSANNIIADCDALLTLLNNRYTTIQSNYNSINAALSNLASIGVPSGAPNINHVFPMLQFQHLSTGTPDIKTASGNYLIPDVGMLEMVSFAQKTPKNLIRPYFGVNISFRPINKNIKFKDIPHKTVLHYLSLSVGLTAYPLNNTDKHISDLLQTFSFMTGLNCRLGRAMRVGTGFVLYKMDNINNSSLPQIITAMPYLSLSADLDVVQWISKLTGKVLW